MDKLHWRWKPENVRRTGLLGGIYQWCRRRAYFSFSSKYFSVHYCISGKHSDPSCPAQGNFTSSAVQTPVSQLSDNWSLCWYHCGASVCDLLDFCCERKMGYLLSRTFGSIFLRLYFVWSVFNNFDCNKCGQTSRLVAGSQIQTSCNFEKNMYNCFWFLDFVHRWFIFYILESSYTSLVSIHSYSSVCGHHNLRLHKNFLYSAS